MISDEAFDLMREAWRQSIPEQYRARPDFKPWKIDTGSRASAIIAPPPPHGVLQAFFDSIAPHLTEPQRCEKDRREGAAQKNIRG